MKGTHRTGWCSGNALKSYPEVVGSNLGQDIDYPNYSFHEYWVIGLYPSFGVSGSRTPDDGKSPKTQ
jgi:hypothetical protein